MKRLEELNYYELLNLDENADLSDIQQAYFIAVSTYSRDSLAAHSILSEEEKTNMIKKIEIAYTTLVDKNKRLFYDREVLKIDAKENNKLMPHNGKDFAKRRDIIVNESETERVKNGFRYAELAVFGGVHLKNIREVKGIALDEIAQKTRIRVSYLKALEDENFEQLPPEVFSKGFLRAYAKYIGLDPEVVIKSYKFSK